MKKRIWTILCLMALLAGCVAQPAVTAPTGESVDVLATNPTQAPTQTAPRPTETAPAPTETQPTQPSATQPPTTQPPTVEPAPTEPAPTEPVVPKKLIVIDAGHQSKANYDKEPNGPGSEELKSKVTSGTQGVSTGLEEYKLNLTVALMLRDILEARGYEVVMIRTSHDVNISNAERAAVANDLKADAFIRIHANGSENPETNGIITICQTPSNPYNGELYEACRALSDRVLEETAAATGGKALYIWETDTMSGINWCTVPVTIVEMGFMSCPWEDELLATEEYQQKLALGIANGIDAYFEE